MRTSSCFLHSSTRGSSNYGHPSCLIDAQAKFDVAMAQKKALEDDAASTQRRMDSANALLSALAGEEGRWMQQSHEFNDTIQRLTGEPITPFRLEQ